MIWHKLFMDKKLINYLIIIVLITYLNGFFIITNL